MSSSFSSNRGGAGRRRRLTADQRRSQILNTAIQLFALGGFAATGTRDLAAACGVSEPILYRHFADKEELFVAAVHESGERLMGEVGAALDNEQGTRSRLEALNAALPDLLDSKSAELSVLLAATHTSKAHPKIAAVACDVVRRIGRQIAAIFEEAPLRHGLSAETAGFLLFQVGMGAAVLRPLAIPEMDDDIYSKRALAVLMQGLMKQSAS